MDVKAERQVQIFLLLFFFPYEEFIKYSLLTTALKEGNLFPSAPKLTFVESEMVKVCLPERGLVCLPLDKNSPPQASTLCSHLSSLAGSTWTSETRSHRI